MDGAGGDVSLLIRRAKRAGARRVDLSNRGLKAWPEELFTLTQLKNIDASGNELTSVSSAFAQLSSLEELDLSNNKVCSLEHLALDGLPSLTALNLEGNPVAGQLDLATCRQLAHGGTERASQVLARLLQRRGNAAPSAARNLEPQTSFLESSATIDPSASASRTDFAKLLAADGENPPAWRTAQKAMLQELETLRERVKELEARGAAEDSSKPSWLRDGSVNRDLAATLPSRRGNLSETNEAAELKTQLREEQRKGKRLEQEVQRLTERLNETRSATGVAGGSAVPHFEVSEVEMHEQINQGGFSVIHRAVWHSTPVAVKKLFDPKINEELLAEFDNEVQKLGQLRHPNILALLAVHRKPPGLSLIMELVEGGSLFQLLHIPHQFRFREPGSTQRDMLAIVETTGVVLAFLHARGVVHRDVKTHNVLLTPALEVKVCDFGLARMRSELNTGAMQFAGTPNYMAPELFKNQKYTDRVDVFAYGTLMWEAMAVDIPFANLDPPEIRDRVLAGKMLQMPAATPAALQEAIEACWTVDQALRPPMVEILRRVREASKADAATAVRARRPRTALGARDAGAQGISR
mmetsp:Transcript_24587/g.56735  ORF Transcript_24587/g.56735 Transcript_24587/m.56735 type:complete len:582 (-) Transcript_24587:32-1777(-)